VLPKGFCRIRHYGLLANQRKAQLLTRSRALLGIPTPEPTTKKSTAEWILQIVGIDVTRCPSCGQPTLERTDVAPLRPRLITGSASNEPAVRDTS
jgi:hypothetical protein